MKTVALRCKIHEKVLTKQVHCEYNRHIKIYHLHWRFSIFVEHSDAFAHHSTLFLPQT